MSSTNKRVGNSKAQYLFIYLLQFLLSIISTISISFYFNYLLQKSMQEDLSFFDTQLFFFESALYQTSILIILFLFLWSLTGRYLISLLIYSSSILSLFYANHQKFLQRNEPIYPNELIEIFNIKDLLTMVDIKSISLYIVYFLITCAILVLFYWKVSPIMIHAYDSLLEPDIREQFLKRKKYTLLFIRLFTLASTSGLLFLSINFNYNNTIKKMIHLEDEVQYSFNPRIVYQRYGFITGFLFHTKTEPMSELPDYSKEKIESIQNHYLNKSKLINQSREDSFNSQKIIYILSESFSDPSKIDYLNISDSPIKQIKDIKEKTQSGTMVASSIGGGTANIEYSSLTSLNLNLFNPQMTIPYTTLLPQQQEAKSILQLYKNPNAYAIHPYTPNLYRRKEAFNKFGFKDFITEDDFAELELIGESNYYSDKSAYNESLRTLEEYKDTNFIQIITMQNHGPNYREFDNREISEVNNDEIQPENITRINNYMRGLNITDDETINFLNKLNEIDENVTVLFYGDHLPYFYLDLNIDKNDPIYYQTEFFVYNTKKENHHQNYESLSPQFFTNIVARANNSKISPFYAILEELLSNNVTWFDKEYCIVDGEKIKISDSNKKIQTLINDFNLVQYDQTTGKNYLSDSFYQINE
ncbi:sulfatase-like hydrolase/transferase [Vagococcus lutrae]|uniref:LTA synthase family protein n=2 Tax=Vagococcus lutrae TaxID=81947 RepID=UPI0020109DC8|nr:alkaline phosphatase family protein [Vagococcus lutrae]UQF22728.1 sulfatase-like hydrolase/transferase [Vagococcus lutrae]UQF63352.1 sulfatase-like hydrolase/transferase [Vagococcus lutrae]